MTFIYTRCPMPTFCPLMDRHFATIQQTLEDAMPALKRRAPGQRQLRSAHRHAAGAEEARARSSTPIPRAGRFSPAIATTSISSRRGSACSVARAENDPRDITHNLRTAIVDADGKLVKIYTGNEWTPEQVLADLKTDWPRARLTAWRPSTRSRAAADRAAAHAGRRAALSQPSALQQGAARPRDAAQLPRRRPPRLRALPRSGALRGGRPRAARLPAARPQLRVDRRARSRDLRLPPERPLGIGRAIARPGPARPQAGVRDAARARAQLLRSVRRLHRPRHRLRRRRLRERWAITTGGWRTTNVWKVERVLLDYPHRAISLVRRPRERSCATGIARSGTANPGKKPVFYSGRERWTPEIPQDRGDRVI